jgi:magnesium-transporting ATPase (P-type)
LYLIYQTKPTPSQPNPSEVNPNQTNSKSTHHPTPPHPKPPLGVGGIPLKADAKYIVVVKGAPNIMAEKCQAMLGANGETVPFNQDRMKETMAVVDDYSNQALRVLAITAKVLCKDF